MPHYPRNFDAILSLVKRDQVISHIQAGLSLKSALKHVGVTYKQIQPYMEYAKQELENVNYCDDDYDEYELLIIGFYRSTQQASAHIEGRLVKQIAMHSASDWKAAAKLLEQINPEEWGPKQKTTPATPGSATPVENGQNPNQSNDPLAGLDLRLLSADELIQLETLLAKAERKDKDTIDAHDTQPKRITQR